MIPEKKDSADIGMAVSAKTLDDLRGLGTSVDQVPDKDQKRFAGRAVGKVSMDFSEQLLEKVEAPVNIANDISAPTACARRSTVLSRSEIKHPVF